MATSVGFGRDSFEISGFRKSVAMFSLRYPDQFKKLLDFIHTLSDLYSRISYHFVPFSEIRCIK